MKSLGGGALMDLNLDVLSISSDCIVIALSHYYRHESGDLIADPDMEIRVFHDIRCAEALTYQDSLRYDQIYPDPDHVKPKLRERLNEFLNAWLSNCLQQGYKLKRIKSKSN